MADHARLSPSGAHRWMRCPGSVSAEVGLPDSTSPFAEEGTTAHLLAQLCLSKGLDTNHVSLDDPAFDEDMRIHVQDYVDYVRALVKMGGSLLVEVRVSLEPYVPGGFGTSDAVVIMPRGYYAQGRTHGFVIDLKYGQGVKVEAEENEQGMLYALGVDRDYGFAADVDDWEIIIIQPRLEHVSHFLIGAEVLRNWGQTKVLPAAKATMVEGAALVPGEKQCRWCKAKAVCPARAEHALDVAREEFTNLPTNLLQPWEVAKLLPRLDEIESWCKAVRDHAQSLAFAGVALPGYKIVEGKSNRVWADQDAVADVLGLLGFEKVFKPAQLIGIPDAEKLLKAQKMDPAKVLSGLIVKPRGKPCLARESDPRPALNVSDAQADFTDIPENTDD